MSEDTKSLLYIVSTALLLYIGLVLILVSVSTGMHGYASPFVLFLGILGAMMMVSGLTLSIFAVTHEDLVEHNRRK